MRAGCHGDISAAVGSQELSCRSSALGSKTVAPTSSSSGSRLPELKQMTHRHCRQVCVQQDLSFHPQAASLYIPRYFHTVLFKQQLLSQQQPQPKERIAARKKSTTRVSRAKSVHPTHGLQRLLRTEPYGKDVKTWQMNPVLFDTDIGSDIDDALCLAYLLHQERCDLWVSPRQR